MSKLACSHRSIRNYKNTPVADALLNQILLCGLRSSSSGNMQTWSVIVTRDKKNKEILYQAHYQQEMVKQAPIVLTFCADVFRMREWIRVHNSKQSFDDLLGFLTGAVDAVVAAQSIALAAEAEGLGICYMGTTWWSANKIIEHLELPQCVFPVTSMVVGYPDENPELRDRLPLELIVHREKYQKLSDKEILAVYKPREKSAWERYNSFPSLKKKLKELGIKKITDFYTSDLKYSKSLHQNVSEMLIKTLQQQNLWI